MRPCFIHHEIVFELKQYGRISLLTMKSYVFFTDNQGQWLVHNLQDATTTGSGPSWALIFDVGRGVCYHGSLENARIHNPNFS